MNIPWFGLGALLLTVAAAAAAGLLVRAIRAHQRRRATRIEPGEQILREARAIPARLSVETSLVGGPQTGGINRGRADLVLVQGMFMVATHYGRVLQIDVEHPGTASCTGPRRLVLEGVHPSGLTRVRLEIMIDDAQGWASAVSAIR